MHCKILFLHICRCQMQPILLLLLITFRSINGQFRNAGGTRRPLYTESVEDPGLKFALTQKGLSYINEQTIKAVNKQMPRLKVRHIERDLGLRGTLILDNLEVVKYKPPEVYSAQFVAPNRIRWIISKTDITLRSDLDGRMAVILPVNLDGVITTYANNMDFNLMTALIRTSDYRLRVHTQSCRTRINSLDLKIENGGFVTSALRDHYGLVTGTVRPILEREMCNLVQEYIIDRFNAHLESYPSKMSLREAEALTFEKLTKPISPRSNKPTTTKKPNWSYLTDGDYDPNELFSNGLEEMKNFFLDYRLVRDPRVPGAYVELFSRGEISYQGRGYTHVEAPRLPISRPHADRMFGLLVSDFVINSALYHGFRSHLLDVNITPSTKKFGSFMLTTCKIAPAVCLGDLVPEMKDQYPNHYLSFRAFPLKAPYIKFLADEDRDFDFLMTSLVYVYATPMSVKLVRQILALKLDVRATGVVNLRNTNNATTILSGNVEFEDVTLTVTKSRIKGIDDGTEMEEFVVWLKVFLEQLVNGVLDKGMPLPLMHGMRMKSIDLKMFTRAAYVSGDVEIDETVMEKLTQNMINDVMNDM